ncbi:MAG: recombinase family protein [Oscillospiraceae bacterium]|nr:recombinase family protein [Oscillospiraceae bacterium]
MGRKRQDGDARSGWNNVQRSGGAPPQVVWRIAVYIRLSREDRNEVKNESESVTNQTKILNEYLEQYFVGEYVVVDFYVDDGLTGTDDTRRDFMRMISDIEDGKINCVLVKTLSRAFRNHADQGYYLEEYFVQKNVRFISTGDPKVDTYLNPEAITGLEVPISGLMNDRFAAKTSADIRRTFNTKRRNGEFIGGFPPYGYLKDPQNKNKLILDPDIVPIKREMYHWIVHESMSAGGVARRLNDMGVPNPTAYKRSLGWNYNNPNLDKLDGLWVGTSVRDQLLNQMNLGHMVQGKQRVVSYKVHDRVTVPEEEWFIVKNTHEAIFTQEEYEALERVLKRDTRTPNGERTVHLFSGFMRCSDCQKALQRKHSGKSSVYYMCRTYSEKSKTKCTRHSIRIDRLEEAVLMAIQAQVALVDSLGEAVDKINQAPVVDTKSKRIEKMLRDKQREVEKTRGFADNLYMAWQSGDITRDDHRRMKTKFEEQIVQLVATIATLEEEQHRMGQGVTRENPVFTHFAKHRNLQALDRPMLLELVDKIYVHEDKEITIHFRFADELERVIEYIQLNAPGKLLAA